VRYTLTPVLVFAIALAAAAPGALAQTAPPTLERVSPTGAQRGKAVTIEIQGSNIAGATRLIFSEPGLSSTITAIKEVPIEKPMIAKGVVRTDAPIDDKAKKYALTATVTIAPDVPHGVHAFRLYTPLGVSNLLRFAVSALPELLEHEPNDAGAPQKVTLPGTLVGALATAGDVDAYEFHARAGEDMVFQVVARPIGSRLDSVIRVRDAHGKVIAENNDLDLNRDSLLTSRFAETGAYVLTVEDIEHGGAKNGYAYRIHAGALSHITSLFPLQPPPGPVTTRKLAELARYGEVPDKEPNDDLGAAQKLAIPSTVIGRIQAVEAAGAARSGRIDQDVFRFSARKGQTLIFEVTAQQLGSPLDSIVEVLSADGRVVPRAVLRSLAQTEVALNDPDSNRRSIRIAAWNEIAINDYLLIGDELLQVEAMPTHPDDDIRLKGFRGVRTALLDTSPRNHSVGEAVYKVEVHPPGARLEPNGMPMARIDYVNDDGGSRFGGKDSRLHFQAPADGEYFVRLRDVRGMEGERFAYRLTVREPAPDFDVTFDPKSFNVPRGGRVSVTVTADRRDGFDGPIDVELGNLPPGLTATAGQIPAGADTTVLMVAAAEDASFEGVKATARSMSGKEVEVPGLAGLKLAGRATIDGRQVTRHAEITEPIAGVALAPRPDLVVTTGTRQIEVVAGQQVALTVAIERHNGFTARVPISVMNLPHGVRVDDIGLNGVMITEQETTRTIHIVVEPWVQPQTQPLLIVGRVEVNSPLRNEAAALPVQLVIKAATTTASRD
jgi:hypothetical protein